MPWLQRMVLCLIPCSMFADVAILDAQESAWVYSDSDSDDSFHPGGGALQRLIVAERSQRYRASLSDEKRKRYM